jgi:hypothetical protein
LRLERTARPRPARRFSQPTRAPSCR